MFFANIPFYLKPSPRGEITQKEKTFDFGFTFHLTPPKLTSFITHDQSNKNYNPNRKSTPNIASCTILSPIKSNSNSGRETKKQNTKRQLHTHWKPKLKGKKNFTTEAPWESELVIDPNIHKLIWIPSISLLLLEKKHNLVPSILFLDCFQIKTYLLQFVPLPLILVEQRYQMRLRKLWKLQNG